MGNRPFRSKSSSPRTRESRALVKSWPKLRDGGRFQHTSLKLAGICPAIQVEGDTFSGLSVDFARYDVRWPECKVPGDENLFFRGKDSYVVAAVTLFVRAY